MLTIEKFCEALNLLPPIPPPMFNPFKLGFGMQVLEARETPVLKLSERCPVGDEFRAEMDLWLLQMFGVRSVVPRGMAYIFGNSIIMRPESVALLKSVT